MKVEEKLALRVAREDLWQMKDPALVAVVAGVGVWILPLGAALMAVGFTLGLWLCRVGVRHPMKTVGPGRFWVGRCTACDARFEPCTDLPILNEFARRVCPACDAPFKMEVPTTVSFTRSNGSVRWRHAACGASVRLTKSSFFECDSCGSVPEASVQMEVKLKLVSETEERNEV